MEQMTRDHILPLSKGGAKGHPNIQLACLPCNQKKGNQTNYKGRPPVLSQKHIP